MICRTCGSVIADTDDFCPKCGTKVLKTAYCAHCGAVLHEDAEFCHKCGTKVPRGVTPAAKEFVEDEYEEEEYEDEEYDPEDCDGEEYEVEEYDEDEYDDGEYDEEDDDDEYDDDSYDEDEESIGSRIAVTVIIVLAVAILLVGLFAGFLFFGGSEKEDAGKDAAVATTEQQQDTADKENGSTAETGTESASDQSIKAVGTVKVVKAVNIRKGASKDGALIRTAKVDETFEYTDVESGWYHIILSDGSQAYVYGEYVEEIKN